MLMIKNEKMTKTEEMILLLSFGILLYVQSLLLTLTDIGVLHHCGMTSCLMFVTVASDLPVLSRLEYV